MANIDMGAWRRSETYRDLTQARLTNQMAPSLLSMTGWTFRLLPIHTGNF